MFAPQLPYLSILIFLPLLGALFIGLTRSDGSDENVKRVALFTSLVTFALSLVVWFSFDPTRTAFQFVEKYDWLSDYGIHFHLGVDGISLLFVVLSAFLTPISILASWRSITQKVKEYMIAFLILETFMIGMFCALDFLFFYIFFEGVLIPMFLIIGIWGGARRNYAAFKFFLFTLLGSLLMLLGILAIVGDLGNTDITKALNHRFTGPMQVALWLAFFASFAVKIPMVPFHTWLPDAHVEAPTAGSVILAGVLLKMGGYGFLRFSLPMFPVASEFFAPFVFALSIIAVVYTSIIAFVQTDMKKLIAYSSVAHMGYVTLGIFSVTEQGVQGAMMQMLSHGIVSAALFLCVGVIYDRLHTREIAKFQGLAVPMPSYASAFMVLMMASIGLPGTSGFVGEVLVLVGIFKVSPWLAAGAATGVVLGACYMLWLYRRIIFGKYVAKGKEALALKDLSFREKTLLYPMVVLVVAFGVYPKPILSVSEASVKSLIQKVIKSKSDFREAQLEDSSTNDAMEEEAFHILEDIDMNDYALPNVRPTYEVSL